jgi:hypothetical protein
MRRLIQGITAVPSPSNRARIASLDEVVRDQRGNPIAFYADGFQEDADHIAKALLSAGPQRFTRQRFENGALAVSGVDALSVLLARFTRDAWDRFASTLPEEATFTVSSTHPATRRHLIPGTGWTGFVVNRDVNLNYHVDSSNAPGWTAVLAMRQEASGGWLHIPDPDIWLPMDNGAVAFFPGLTTWHGVSPIEAGPGGYRFSLVVYPKRFVPRRKVMVTT